MAVPVCCAMAGPRDAAVLDYQLKYQRRNETVWVETRFQLIADAGLVMPKKQKRPRLGRWRLKAAPGPGAAVLAQAASLMYFAGPAPELVRKPTGMVLGRRSCPLWQAPVPPGVPAYVYLAEVAPDLLALCYLSASLRQGDLAAVELHLTGLSLGAHPCPAEDGMALLRTLARWTAPGPVAVAAERVE